MEDRLVSQKEVEEAFGVKKTKLYQMLKSNQCPQPIIIAGMRRWSAREVDEYIRQKIEQQSAGSRGC